MSRVAFVSCVKTKSETPELAEHLYISPWFRMARQYAIRNSDRWFNSGSATIAVSRADD
jgi:hypothetical protein